MSPVTEQYYASRISRPRDLIKFKTPCPITGCMGVAAAFHSSPASPQYRYYPRYPLTSPLVANPQRQIRTIPSVLRSLRQTVRGPQAPDVIQHVTHSGRVVSGISLGGGDSGAPIATQQSSRHCRAAPDWCSAVIGDIAPG